MRFFTAALLLYLVGCCGADDAALHPRRALRQQETSTEASPAAVGGAQRCAELSRGPRRQLSDVHSRMSRWLHPPQSALPALACAHALLRIPDCSAPSVSHRERGPEEHGGCEQPAWNWQPGDARGDAERDAVPDRPCEQHLAAPSKPGVRCTSRVRARRAADWVVPIWWRAAAGTPLADRARGRSAWLVWLWRRGQPRRGHRHRRRSGLPGGKQRRGSRLPAGYVA